MSKEKAPEINLLETIPEKLFTSITKDDGLVVVNMPRFHVEWMQKYLVPKWKDPFIKIKLDEFGSHTWEKIDGKASILAIVDSLVEEYGEAVQPVEERLAQFFTLLKQRGFVSLKTPDGTVLK
mgnify:CR=1 FL=1